MMKIEMAERAARNAESIRRIDALIARIDKQDAPNAFGIESREIGLWHPGEGSDPAPTPQAAREMRAVLRRDLREQLKNLNADQLGIGIE